MKKILVSLALFAISTATLAQQQIPGGYISDQSIQLTKVVPQTAGSVLCVAGGSPASPAACPTLPTAAMPALSGDVQTSAGSTTTAIAAGAVTDTKASLSNKPSVGLVATSNLTLSGAQTIDGVLGVAGTTLVLATGQTATSQNGPWLMQTGAWTRPTWYPSGGTTQALQFSEIKIRLGTIYQNSTWRLTSANPMTIDTTAQTWAITPYTLNSNTVSGTLSTSILPLTSLVSSSPTILANVGGLTLTVTGTAGSINWAYSIVARNANGQALASYPITTSTGNATLNSSNYNALAWSAVTGATSYDVYRTVQGSYLSSAPSTTAGISGCTGSTSTITFAAGANQSLTGPYFGVLATGTVSISAGAPTGSVTITNGGSNFVSAPLYGSYSNCNPYFGVFSGGAITATSPNTVGKIATTTSLSYNDQGAAGDGTQLPSVNGSTTNTAQYVLRTATGITLVVEGDSKTAGHGLSRSADLQTACRTTINDTSCQDWPQQLLSMSTLKGRVAVFDNFAVSGSLIATMQARYTGSVHPLSPVVTGNPGILLIRIGANDIATASATVLAAYKTYINGAKADGWVLGWSSIEHRGDTDVLDTTGADEVIRQTINDGVRGMWQQGYFDVFLDFDHQTQSPWSSQLFLPDYVHQSAAGHYADAKYVNQALWGDGQSSALTLQTDTWKNLTTMGPANEKTGPSALVNLTTGSNNYGGGYHALLNDTTGSDNTGLGAFALNTNTTGQYNFGGGFDALYSNTSGQFNIGIGFQALYFGTSGSNNIGVGASALENMTTTSNGTAVGVSAGGNLTGGGNTALGANALKGAIGSTGTNNVAVGYNSALVITSAVADVCVGFGTCSGLAVAQVDTCIGWAACTSGTDDGGSNTAIGGTSLSNMGSSATQNIGVGLNAGNGCVSCSKSGGLGYNALLGAAVINAYQIGAGTNSASNTLQFLTNKIADSSGNLYSAGIQISSVIPASLTTTAATSDTVTVTGMTSSGHCSLTATNTAAAAAIAGTYVSAKTTNQITVTHAVTASMTYDVLCTAN